MASDTVFRGSRLSNVESCETEAAPDAVSRPPTVAGKWVILVMVALALVSATGNLAYQRFLGRRPAEFWGEPTTSLIARAPLAQLAELLSATDRATTVDTGECVTGRRIAHGEHAWQVGAVRDVRQAPSFSHLRRSLLQHPTFTWQQPSPSSSSWRWVLRFADNQHQALLLFSTDARAVVLSGGTRPLGLTPDAAAAVSTFFKEQFPEVSARSDVSVEHAAPRDD